MPTAETEGRNSLTTFPSVTARGAEVQILEGARTEQRCPHPVLALPSCTTG